MACFTEDAVYAWGPWAEPLRGHDEIRAATERAIATQEDIKFGHEPLAITPDGRGIARWWVSTRAPGEDTIEENEGIFLVTLDDAGLCTEFREWWNSRSLPASDHSVESLQAESGAARNPARALPGNAITLNGLDRWLDAYGRAWEQHEPSATLACFDEAAVYQWGPWGETVRGHAEICARSERSRAEQGNVSFGHEPLAITADGRGLARRWASVEAADGTSIEDLEGIFLVTLDGGGKCTEFREWWNSSTRPAS